MKRVLFWMMVMLFCACGAIAAEEDSVRFSLSELPREGDRQIRLKLSDGFTGLQAGAFADNENLTDAVTEENGEMVLRLLRTLKAGETIRIAVEGEGTDQQKTIQETEITVGERFGSKLQSLRERVDRMWGTLNGSWMKTLKDGKILIPNSWKQLAFATWPDEAPDILVQEDGQQVTVFLRDEDASGWRVCLGNEIPVVYTECVFDPETGGYTAEGDFESVWLISDAGEERIGISMEYRKDENFLPPYPVLEWEKETETEVIGFSCYGWGNTRSFSGAMYVVNYMNTSVMAAEYAADGRLVNYTDLLTDCVYDADDRLISGTEPEGYQNPVIH